MTTSSELSPERDVEQMASEAASELARLHGSLGIDGERRRFVRSDYSASGMIAWSSGKALPPVGEFTKVNYHDISNGGVSFYWPAEPEQEEAVVVMRTHDSVIVLKGNIAYSHLDEENGRWIVGCQFMRRIRVMND